MSQVTKILIGMIIIFIIMAVSTGMFLWSAKVTAGKMENGIIAIYEDMQNVYANSIVQTLEGKGKVTQQYKNDLLEIVKANMLRYENDQNLMFKAVSESANLTLTPELYKDLSKSIEVGYKTFEGSQRTKIDRVRAYKDYLDNSFKGLFAKGLFDYPSDKAKYLMDKLISNNETQETFKTGEMGKIDMFNDKK